MPDGSGEKPRFSGFAFPSSGDSDPYSGIFQHFRGLPQIFMENS